MTGSHISLFAGVGMTDIAVEAAGYTTVATAEIDPFCRQVLRARFPYALHHGDVRHVSNLPLNVGYDRPLLISGGFPCQDVASLRGTDDGINGKRTGLWTEFARIIREFRPELVLIENSPLLRGRGLDRVLLDLYERGYDARWDCIPAAAAGAPMLRDRLWVVAWPQRPQDRSLAYASDAFLGAVNVPMVAWYLGSKQVHKLPRAGGSYDGALCAFPPAHTVKDSKTVPTLAQRFPSPRAHMNEWRTTRNAPSHGSSHGKTLAGELNDLERLAGNVIPPSSDNAGNVNPGWVEWLMGLPIGWTDPAVDNADLIRHNRWTDEPTVRLAPMPKRKDRLRTLGNGLVPQVAALALNELSPGGTP